MSKLRQVLMAAAVAALMGTVLGAPASAADTQGTLAIVNGIPGKRVDVCIDGNEISSGLRYGRTVLRDVISTGAKNLKVYARDPRRCRGDLLARRSFALAAGDDLTIVATKHAEKVVIFSNTVPTYFGEIPPAGATIGVGFVVFRHASDVAANFFVRSWVPSDDDPVDPSAFPLAVKGEEVANLTFNAWEWRLRVTRPEDPETIAIKKVGTEVSRRYEWIFVGSNPGNARIVLLDRRISSPSD